MGRCHHPVSERTGLRWRDRAEEHGQQRETVVPAGAALSSPQAERFDGDLGELAGRLRRAAGPTQRSRCRRAPSPCALRRSHRLPNEPAPLL